MIIYGDIYFSAFDISLYIDLCLYAYINTHVPVNIYMYEDYMSVYMETYISVYLISHVYRSVYPLTCIHIYIYVPVIMYVYEDYMSIYVETYVSVYLNARICIGICTNVGVFEHCIYPYEKLFGIDQVLLQCVASVLQCVAVCCDLLCCDLNVLLRMHRVSLQRVALCCRVLQFVAVCCSVLQCVAVCCDLLFCGLKVLLEMY